MVDMVNAIVPPPPKDNRLSQRLEALSGFIGSKTGPTHPPPSSGEPIELRYSHKPTVEVVDEENLRVKAKFTVKAAERAPGEATQVEVGCTLVINEDRALAVRSGTSRSSQPTRPTASPKRKREPGSGSSPRRTR